MADVLKVLKRIDAMFTSSERCGHEDMWKDLTKYLLNNQAGISSNSAPASYRAGQKETTGVFTSVPGNDVQTLSSAFQSLLTNPATIWSRLREERDELNNNEEVNVWLEECNATMHRKLHESNFYPELGKAYQSYVALANTIMLEEEAQPGKLKFTTLHMGQVVWAEDAHGRIDTIAWKFEKTALQAVELWGDGCSVTVQAAAKETPDKKFEFILYISPRAKELVKLNEMGLAAPKERPFQSLYIDVKEKMIVHEDGYYEFPGLPARVSLRPGDTYAYGPGHIALPDVKSLNKLVEEYLFAVAKDNNPPLDVNQRDILGDISSDPGSLNVMRNIQGMRERVSQARTDRTIDMLERLERNIKSVFFLDKLMLPPRQDIGQMREAEVLQRVKEINTVLGPVALRMKDEFLNPLVFRTFNMLLRSGEFPPVPKVLETEGLKIEIVFVNELENAQHIQTVQNIQQWLQQVIVLSQNGKPEALDLVDADPIVKIMAKSFNVSETLVTNDDVVKEIRDARAQMQEQQMQMQQANMAADTMAKASNTQGGQEGA